MIVGVIVCLGYNKLYFELKLPNGTVAQILDVMEENNTVYEICKSETFKPFSILLQSAVRSFLFRSTVLQDTR
jgi:hypothetical protein